MTADTRFKIVHPAQFGRNAHVHCINELYKSAKVSKLNTWLVKMVKSCMETDTSSGKSVVNSYAKVDFVEGKDGPGLFFPFGKLKMYIHIY